MSLFKEFQGENLKVFKQLYEEHHAKLYRFVLKHTNDPQQSQLIVKEIFSSMWKNQHWVSASMDVNNYLFELAKKYILDNYRNKLMDQKQYNFVLLNALEEAKNNREKVTPHIQSAINQLPPRRQAILTMHKLENKSKQEIAEELSISEQAVETHLVKAMKFLREHIATTHNE